MPFHEHIHKLPTDQLAYTSELEEVEKQRIMRKHFCVCVWFTKRENDVTFYKNIVSFIINKELNLHDNTRQLERSAYTVKIS